jgi:iron(III) transport system substrate-binding protein
MQRNTFLALVAVVVVVVVALPLLWPQKHGVTVYCAVDDVHSRPILEAFEKETGIEVVAVFDTEANKTVGLVRRILEERDEPQCDVFWNNEILHTIRLAGKDVFEPYDSPSAAEIPSAFRDPKNRWTGFGARARILIVNTEALPDAAARPASMQDLVDAKWKGQAAFVRPLTGTTLTHALSAYTVLGEDGARAWLKGLFENDVNFPPGNGPAARMVAGGQKPFGFTDTDDFRKQQLLEKPVTLVYPDQGEGQPGTLFIPNTVGLIKGAPNSEAGKRLVDYLLSKQVEEALAHGDSAQIPVRGDVKRPDYVKGPPEIRPMEVDWDDVAEHTDARLEELQGLWGR